MYTLLTSMIHGDVALLMAVIAAVTTAAVGMVVEHIVHKIGRWILRTLTRRFAG